MKNLRYLFLATLTCGALTSQISLVAADDLSRRFAGAIINENFNDIEDLIAAAADIGGIDAIHRNDSPKTPLFEAVIRGKVDIIQRLRDAGADINQRLGGQRQSALHIAVIHNQLGSIQKLIELGADLNPVNGQDKTPLDGARDKPELHQALRDAGARYKIELEL